MFSIDESIEFEDSEDEGSYSSNYGPLLVRCFSCGEFAYIINKKLSSSPIKYIPHVHIKNKEELDASNGPKLQ